jgi:hypothetical protein
MVVNVGLFELCDGTDGFPDLVLHWNNDFIKVALGNTSEGDEFPMQLPGYLGAGWFWGREDVHIMK